MPSTTHSWQWTPLGEVLTERKESPPPTELASGAIRIIAKIGFNDGQIQIRPGTMTRTGMILVGPGDLVVSGINAAKGAIAIYGEENRDPVAATIHYGSYIPNRNRADVRFLWWLLRSQIFREILDANLPGGIKTELKAKRLLPIKIPLPPLDEQRRIVSRVEELAAKVGHARVLRSESSSRLNALIESHLSAIFRDRAARFGLQSLGDLIIEANYGTSKKCDQTRLSDAVPVLRIPNVASELINQDGLKYATLTNSELRQLQVREGDILVVRTNGSIDLVGRCAVVPSLSQPTAFASYLIRLRVAPERVHPDYLQLMLKHLRTDGTLIDFARTTAGQYNVSLGRLRAAQIPVPPIHEQREIVNQIRTLEAKTIPLRSLQAQTAGELDALMPSILSKAFHGEL